MKRLFRNLGLVIGLGLALLFTASAVWYSLSLRPVDVDEASPVDFVLASGDGVPDVASALEERGLVRSRLAFIVFVTLRGERSNLQAGAYRLSRAMSLAEIVRKLSSGEVDLVRLTIPEGFTMNQIANLMLQNGQTEDDIKAAFTADYAYDFLKARPAGASLEGYLFPDTYHFPKRASSRDMLDLMLTTFGKRLTPDLLAGFERQKLSLHQAVTLASLVEKEARRDEDRPVVAQVFLRRLSLGMKLDSDVTVQYAASIDPKDQAATAKAIQSLNSPYNTYKQAGLPPGPIANPGLASLQAVAAPASSDYLYFVASADGVTHFARTLQEHEHNINKYLR